MRPSCRGGDAVRAPAAVPLGVCSVARAASARGRSHGLVSCRYHMECLEPPLQEVPVDEWFCPECATPRAAATATGSVPQGRAQPSRGSGLCWGWGTAWCSGPAGRAWQPCSSPGSRFPQDAGLVSEEEVSLLLADTVPTTSRLRPRAGRTRAIARTRQSERVRATVNRNRMSTASRIQVELPVARAPLPLPPRAVPQTWS